MAENSTAGGGEGDGPEGGNLALALTIGLPSGLVIVILVVVISVMVWLIIRTSRTKHDVEAVYMRRRFQGLSLADQEQMQKQRKKKRVRRSSSTGESHASSAQLSESMQRARVRKANPFGLQEWQLRLSGIKVVEGEAEETLMSDEEEEGFYNRKPIGAINPLLMHEDAEEFGEERLKSRTAVSKQPLQQQQQQRTAGKPRQGGASASSVVAAGGQRSRGMVLRGERSQGVAGYARTIEDEESSEEESSSDDSLNPYDA